MRSDAIVKKRFAELDLEDPFFDSLRTAYRGFDSWFNKKALAGERAFVTYDDEAFLVAMMYLKVEEEPDENVDPPLIGKRLKIGTFKVDFDHHTGLGRRYLSLALREFATSGCRYVYVTMFESSGYTRQLRFLLERYGFSRRGQKGNETVLVKARPQLLTGHPYTDFPFVDLGSDNFWILSIWPEYHVRLFGETDLRSEWGIPVEDEKSINSIEKIYLSGARNAPSMSPGDRVVIYRTGDGVGSAKYRAVASSICTVVEVRDISEFPTEEDFLQYIGQRSVFSEEELISFWEKRKYPWLITFLYNIPFKRYPTRGILQDNGLLPSGRIVCEPINAEAVLEIAR